MNFYFETKQLWVGYNKKPVVKDLEIGINRGEILTLIGPNGAGKSTVLKSIARQLSLVAGIVMIDKQNLVDITGELLSQKMAVVLTEKIKTEIMTCEDVVATGRYPYTGRFGILSKHDYEIVAESMKLVHVTEIKDKDFTQISDGQRQRVMLARAICQEPEIIILDEPTSYLDVKYKLEFLSVLQDMCRQKGLTVIMSLHELELADRVSDKILCVNGEYAGSFGKPEEIFKSGYISELFGISMGSFDEENGNMELDVATGECLTFVIAGGGCGRNVYRKLQREAVPFATGILYKNDLDYPSARALSTTIYCSDAFEPIPLEIIEQAKKKIKKCTKVICCKTHFGTFEKVNEELLQYAKNLGKEIEIIS